MSLDQLLDLEVTGASKFAVRLSESPSSATVIGAEEIRALGYRTVGEVLQSVRGLLVSSDRSYAYLGVRGYAVAGDYNTRILLLVDGNRVNDTVYEQALIGDEFPLDLDLVERIEFIPGQGSAVHGSNALFGVINVVTRKIPSRASADVSVSAGSGVWQQLRLSASRPLGEEGGLLVSASKRQMAGTDAYYAAYDAPATFNGISHQTDHERGERLYLQYQHAELSTTLLHGDRTKGSTAFPGLVFGDPRSQYRDATTLFDATLAHRLDAENVWKLRAYAGHYEFVGDYAVEGTPVVLSRDEAQSRWWGVETNLYTQHYEGHRLLVGADLQRSPHRDQRSFDVDPPSAPYLDDRRTNWRQSLFAEDQWTASPRVSVTLGLRYDRLGQERTTSQFSPRLAVVARPSDNTVLKLIHGRAFRSPNAYESYYAVGGTVGYKGNDQLENERVRGTEAVLEYRPSVASRWLVSAYENRADRLLMQTLDTTDSMLVFHNSGAMRMRGLELEAERVWPSGARVRGNASVQSANDRSGQSLVPDSVLRLGKLAVVLPVGGGWTAGSQTVLVSRRGEVAGYGVTHLTLTRSWNADRSHLSVGVYDLLDRQPNDPGGDSVLQPVSPQDGRTWRVELKQAF